MAILFASLSASLLPAQNIDLDWYVGTWKYENASAGDELIIKLKKSQFTNLPTFGGSVENCLVGVYRFKKNNQLWIDKLDTFNENLVPFSCPITINLGKNILNLLLCVTDYTIVNGRGEYKTINVPSRIEYNSSAPKTIKWKIVVEEQEYFYYAQIDRFPEGTNLPTDIILTKVE